MLRVLVTRLSLAAIMVCAGTGLSSADAGFNRWVQDFWKQAQAAGITADTYNRAFSRVTPDPEVIKKAEFQPEFIRPMAKYVSGAVSDKRLEDVRRKLREHSRLLDAIERTYNVDRHIVVAVWGMESSYGAVLENPKIVRNVIRSLATLAYYDKRRARFARKQLLASLKILQRGDINVDNMTGSWAGAMGHTQFIPTTFEAYAVDFDGDGRRDVWSEVDALASTASYLDKAGWRTGKTWGYEVELPGGFNYGLADSDDARVISEWVKLGIKRVAGRGFPRADDKAILVLPSGASGPAFLMLRNHYVIKRYNNATAYAIAVGHLADRLRGGPAFASPWSAEERSLIKTERREMQQHLGRLGFYKGPIDGKIGPQSRRAIRAFQNRAGLVADGFAGSSLLMMMRQGSS